MCTVGFIKPTFYVGCKDKKLHTYIPANKHTVYNGFIKT